MPKASRSSSVATRSSTTTRRSSRLNSNRKEAIGKADVYVEIPEVAIKRRRLADDVSQISEASRVCTGEMKASRHATASAALRRPQRTISTDLKIREDSLKRREQELKHRSEDLEKRLRSIQQKEDQVTSMVQSIQEREARSALAMLEEQFTCPLCYEVMAHPYSLNPGQCGHTFCSLCIIKWFFSRLHTACGGWHESVDCPICRSLLIVTPERVPRLDLTFPFVPNRTTNAAIKYLVEKVSCDNVSGSASVIKTEERESTWESARITKKDSAKEEEDATADTSAWRIGGIVYVDWQKRDREGRKEMDHLASNWTMLKTEYFVRLKQKLGV